MAKNILLIIGARPNFMKCAPVYHALKEYDLNLEIIHTGQHFDSNMSDVFLRQLDFPNDFINLGIKLYSPCQQISEIMLHLDNYFKSQFVHLIIVFGDITSTLAGALAGNKNGIPIAHIEAGNRSFDMNMPEEINRILVDSISTYYFISEPNGIDNLLTENKIKRNDENKTWFYVGNPMIDTLLKFKNHVETLNTFCRYGLQKGKYIVITLHRPSNVDDKTKLNIILGALNELGIKIIFPVHPRTRKNLIEIYQNVLCIDPQDYFNFINLMINSGLVITDSGGIQEETTILNVPCITLRENTERPITCTHGTNFLLNDITRNNIINKSKEMYGGKIISKNIKYWDGNAGKRIAEIIYRLVR